MRHIPLSRGTAFFAALTAAGVLVLTACQGDAGQSAAGQSASPAPGTGQDTAQPAAQPAAQFVGKVEGTDAYIGIVINPSGQALAYVCDNYKISPWLKGTATGEKVELTADDGTRLDATRKDDTVTGTLTLGGADHTVTATAASPPAGVYRATATRDGVAYTIGYVTLPDGTQRGSVKADTGQITPSPPLEPGKTQVEIAEVGLVDILLIDKDRTDLYGYLVDRRSVRPTPVGQTG